jgi:hypothetical protein
MTMIRLTIMTCAVVLAAACWLTPARAEQLRLAAETQTATLRLDRFVAADAFRVGARIGERTVGLLGLEFETTMLPVVETDVRPIPLRAWTLRYSADDMSLIKSIGGESLAVVPLSAVYQLMAQGERGGSHPDWRSNLAYVRLSDGRLRAVHWFVDYKGEWVIGAALVPHPNVDWPGGSRVFGRASGYEPVEASKVSEVKRWR